MGKEINDSYETRHYKALEALDDLQRLAARLPTAGRRTLEPVLTHLQATLEALEAPATRQDREDLYRFHDEQLDITRLGTLSEMIRVLGHELNQPLAAIVSYAQSCLQMADNGLTVPEDVYEGLEQIALQGRRAAQLIARLREISRLKPLPRERVDINRLIEQVVTFNRREIQRLGLHLEMHLETPTIPLWVNGCQLRHTLLNLIHYTLHAQAEALNLSTRNRDVWMVLHLDVLGPSFQPGDLFDPFLEQSLDTRRIGLTVARSIVESHGGRLEVEPLEGGGIRFVLSLPYTPHLGEPRGVDKYKGKP